MYHLKNSLYTACKVGDKEALKSLLAILFSPQIASMEVKGQEKLGQGHRNEENLEGSFKELGQGQGSEENVEGSFKEIDEEKRNEENMEGSLKGTTEIEFEHLGNKGKAGEPSEDINVEGSEKTTHSQKENALDETPVSNIIISQQSKSCAVNDFIKDELKLNVNETHKSHSNSISASSNINTETDVEKEKEISQCPNLHLKEAENYVSEKVSSEPDISNENIADVNPSKENSTDAGIDYSKSQSAVHSGKASLNLVTTGSMLGMLQMWTDYSPVVTPALLSEPFGDNNTTFLHVAAKEGHGKIIAILMEAGANPALRYIGSSFYIENVYQPISG